jgi:hypothetical protein
MAQRRAVDERVSRHVGEILRPLEAGRHWFAPEISKARDMLGAALADAAVLDAIIAELDAIDASIAAGAGWERP